jgi:four helix bundle protein
MSYKDLGIWRESRELVILIHRVTLERLPKFEMYEEGSQIRRSMKSTKSNIVEGYGRRRYKQNYLRFLVYAHASCDETRDHWETLFETGSVQDEEVYNQVHSRLEELSKSIHRFIEGVQREHRSVREEHAEYTESNT